MTDTDTLRAIEPLPDCTPENPPALGRKPELLWAAIANLRVDDAYQRDLTKKSFALIKRLVEKFAWRKMKPPVVVRVGKVFHVIDGQHTAIAALTLGLVEIPVFCVDAADARERAESFVAHNMDRLVMAPLDVFRAQLGAGDVVACLVDRAVRQAGCRLKVNSRFVRARVGDTAAVSSIRQLIQRRGVDVATELLRAFAQAGAGPISAAEIAAAEVALCVPLPGYQPTEARLCEAIKRLGPDGVVTATARATNERVATKVVLAREYRRLMPRQDAA